MASKVSDKYLISILNKEYLYEQHYKLNKSRKEIGREVGCSDVSVYKYMKLAGVLPRGKEILIGTKNPGSSKANKTHGLSKTRIYNIWNGMIQRCNNPNVEYYNLYGGRGIKVCKEWHKFVNFYNDTKDGYAPHLTIERIDGNFNYEPSNCKWVTSKEQQQNRMDTVRLTINGCIGTIREWSDISGTNFDTIWSRYYHKWPHEECVYGRKKEALN